VGKASEPSTYATAVVHRELGDAASHIRYTAAKRTWKQCCGRLGKVIIPHNDFSEVLYVALETLPADIIRDLGCDDVGAKIEIADWWTRTDLFV
jgi:hypothetical protein